MRRFRMIALASAVLFSSLLPRARADEWDQKTIFTFNVPVEVPGQVLGPGTYVFKLADSQADRNIVQIFNKEGNHIYGTFLTVPDYRLEPAGRTIITFRERAAGSPEAVRAWFYPGETFGHQFVYPKTKAAQLAKANQTPVASMPNEMEANTTKPATTMQEPHVAELRQAPLKAQQPDAEVDLSEVFTAQVNAAAPQDPSPVSQNLSDTLPATASSVPLIAMVGIFSIVTGVLLVLNPKKKEK